VKPSFVGKCFLGQVGLFPSSTNHSSEFVLDFHGDQASGQK